MMLGGCLIEKHVKLKNSKTPDSFSETPASFKNMVEDIKNLEKAMKNKNYQISIESKNNFKS